jgi:hypothetical protein
MQLNYEELKQYLWKTGYRGMVDFLEEYEEKYSRCISKVRVYSGGGLKITFRDQKTYEYVTDIVLPPYTEGVKK